MAHNLFRIAFSYSSRANLTTVARCNLSTSSALFKHPEFEKIGSREIVGHGFNGQPAYMDRVDFPMPAIRFKENTPDILKLREKEKGDWKNLSMEEKKALYRASFCLTFAELKAPTGGWKVITAGVLTIISVAFWALILMRKFVYPPPLASLSDEWKEASLKRMIGLQMNPIEGVSSKWDYEKERWKD